ncbi:hypothetical protein [Streptomyces sp. NPDC047061]|uniref:hypothetical protein n=1 Tax=Streptomyces sp. NPDC047061 TaxID=3154605 RepID=UPI00340233D4
MLRIRLRTRRKAVPDGRPFYQQRGWVRSALVLGSLLALSLVVIVTDDGKKGTDLAAAGREALAGLSGPLSPGDPLGVRRGTGGRPAGCRTDDGNTERSAASPRDLRWRQLGTMMVPTSPSAGPLHRDDDLWWCFARTPVGAVLAAHTILVELSGTHWRTVTEQQIVPGNRRDRFISLKAVAGEPAPGTGGAGRYVGFTVPSYARDSATVQLLVTNPVGGYLSTSVSLRWRDGDWKLDPLGDGSLYTTPEQTQPFGFVQWGS